MTDSSPRGPSPLGPAYPIARIINANQAAAELNETARRMFGRLGIYPWQVSAMPVTAATIGASSDRSSD